MGVKTFHMYITDDGIDGEALQSMADEERKTHDHCSPEDGRQAQDFNKIHALLKTNSKS